MPEQYAGWNLFNKVIIIATPILQWDQNTRTHKPSGFFQGYVVDPKNKSMLKNARKWGTWYEYIPMNDGSKNKVEHKPEEYFYDNNNFTLNLCDAADNSSQGGKLSFWNCNITAPDGQTFLIGIAANLLLDVLKNNTTTNGTIQAPLCFARKSGQVGMLSENMQSYQDALQDMQTKENMSVGKTKNHIIGHTYETATLKNIYLGKIYNWYEPIFEEVHSGYSTYYNRTINTFRGLKKRESPVEMYLFPDYKKNCNKLSDYIGYHYYNLNYQHKIPARKEASEIIDFDISIQEFLHLNALHHINRNGQNNMSYYVENYLGWSDNSESYTIPNNIREIMLRNNFTIED